MKDRKQTPRRYIKISTRLPALKKDYAQIWKLKEGGFLGFWQAIQGKVKFLRTEATAAEVESSQPKQLISAIVFPEGGEAYLSVIAAGRLLKEYLPITEAEALVDLL